jgi:hypothetical protein
MSISSPVILCGHLTAEGVIKLDSKPALRPGRVRITLEALSEKEAPCPRLPDKPWLDEGIPAPLDLPHFGMAQRVQPRPATDRLPEVFELPGEGDS